VSDYADLDDLQTMWPEMEEELDAPATVLVSTASDIVRMRVADLDDRLTAGDIEASIPRLVVTTMVRRFLSNPDLVKARTLGTFSEQLDVELLRGGLNPTADELNLLRPPTTTTRSPVGMARMRPVL